MGPKESAINSFSFVDNQNYPQFHFAIIKQIIIDFLYDAPDLNVADDTTSHSKKAGVMKK